MADLLSMLANPFRRLFVDPSLGQDLSIALYLIAFAFIRLPE
jgi:hypothetical protein